MMAVIPKRAGRRASGVLLLVLHAFAVSPSANDYLDEESRRQGELREARRLYRILSARDATDENVLSTLDTGGQVIAVQAALDIAGQDSALRSGIPLRTLLALGESGRAVAVRVASARILMDRDKASAIATLKAVLRSDTGAAIYRMQAADALLAEGDLGGYPEVKTIFLGKKPVEAKAAAYYLARYLPFEGRPVVPGRPARIDTRATAAKGESEPRRLFELYAAVMDAKRKEAARGRVELRASLIGLSPDTIRVECVLSNRGYPEIGFNPAEIDAGSMHLGYFHKLPHFPMDGTGAIRGGSSGGSGVRSHARPYVFEETARLQDGESFRKTLAWPIAVFSLGPEEEDSLDCAGIHSLLDISLHAALHLRKPGETDPSPEKLTARVVPGPCREIPE